MLPRRRFLIQWALAGAGLAVGCSRRSSEPIGKLVVGVVSYDEGARTVDQYEEFKQYLAQQARAIVELEPAFNELQALEQVRRRAWSIVFASPGLAAIAIGQEQYIPMFPTQGVNNFRSLIVVLDESPIDSLGGLANEVIALGEPGSAAGYYLPLYDLYGLTLREVRFAPTPKTMLEWISDGSVVAGAIAEDQFQLYRRDFPEVNFRVLHTSRPVPPGLVLLGPTIDRNQQQQIETVLRQAPPTIVADAGYVPNVPLPAYDQFIQLIDKVRPLEDQVRQQPAVLVQPDSPADSG